MDFELIDVSTVISAYSRNISLTVHALSWCNLPPLFLFKSWIERIKTFASPVSTPVSTISIVHAQDRLVTSRLSCDISIILRGANIDRSILRYWSFPINGDREFGLQLYAKSDTYFLSPFLFFSFFCPGKWIHR